MSKHDAGTVHILGIYYDSSAVQSRQLTFTENQGDEITHISKEKFSIALNAVGKEEELAR